jgi:hypothetical protein
MSTSAPRLSDVHESIASGDEVEVVTRLRMLPETSPGELTKLFDDVCKAKMAVAAHLVFERGLAPTLERYEQALLCGIEAIACQLIVRGAQDSDSKRARVRTAIRAGYPELGSDLLYRAMERWDDEQPLFSQEEFQRLKGEIDADDLTGPRRPEDQQMINACKVAYEAERAGWCKENMAAPELGFRYRDALYAGDIDELRQVLADGLVADSSWHDASLLEHAALAGEGAFVEALLAEGAKAGPEAGVLLTHAAEHQRPDIIRALVSGGVDINAARYDGCTALYVAVSRTFSDALIALLLSLGARIDAVDVRGRSVLDASRVEYRESLRVP